MIVMSAEQPAPIQLASQEWQQPTLPVLKVVYPGDAVTVVGCCHMITDAELTMVAEKAEQTFLAYKQTPHHERAAILERLAAGIQQHAENLAKLITLECGKPIKLSNDEVNRAIEVCRGYANQLAVNENRVVQVQGREATIRPFPVGPVLAITPYNFPLNLVVHKVAPAIAAGCSITVKPSSKTPLTALYLGRLAAEAGYNALQVVPAESAVAEKLVKMPVFKKFSFTGSDSVGWRLAQQSATKKITLECGGNAACIINDVPDNKLKTVARRLAHGAFDYSGQSCIAVQRVLVKKDLLEELTPLLIQEARNLVVGNPLLPETDIGPMITPEDVFRVRNLIKNTINTGGNVVYGGNTYNALTMNPTIFNRTAPAMAINTDEVFGPVMTLEGYDDFDAALATANTSRYGLQVGVYTQDWQKTQRAYDVMDVGGVMLNDVPTTRLDVLPYGGVKASGLGREGVMTGIAEMSVLKTLVMDRTFGQ